MLAKGDEESEEDEEDELTSMAGSLVHAELGDSSKQVEPEVGAGDVAGDAGNKEDVKPVVSQENITKDYTVL